MPLKTSQVEELPGLNLTSMIDVVFLLLIFFMVATKFSESQQQIDIKMSSGTGLQAMVAAPDQRNVSVAADGSITLDGQPVSLNELTNRLLAMRAQYPGLVVGVKGDPKANYETVFEAQRAVRVAGAEVRAGVWMR
jgi:biopolymer transport protein ExbD